jgi:hypothetical protein
MNGIRTKAQYIHIFNNNEITIIYTDEWFSQKKETCSSGSRYTIVHRFVWAWGQIIPRSSYSRTSTNSRLLSENSLLNIFHQRKLKFNLKIGWFGGLIVHSLWFNRGEHFAVILKMVLGETLQMYNSLSYVRTKEGTGRRLGLLRIWSKLTDDLLAKGVEGFVLKRTLCVHDDGEEYPGVLLHSFLNQFMVILKKTVCPLTVNSGHPNTELDRNSI